MPTKKRTIPNQTEAHFCAPRIGQGLFVKLDVIIITAEFYAGFTARNLSLT
jgi:hypothetical protein